MNILELISNPITPIIALASGALLWQLANFFYTHFKLASLAKENVYKLGNHIGLQLKKYVLDKVKDEALREKMMKDLDASGDEFDEGFDAGIRGNKLT